MSAQKEIVNKVIEKQTLDLVRNVIAKKVVMLRKVAGLDRKTLAMKAGVGATTIWNIEHGNIVSFKNIEKVAIALGVSTAYLSAGLTEEVKATANEVDKVVSIAPQIPQTKLNDVEKPQEESKSIYCRVTQSKNGFEISTNIFDYTPNCLNIIYQLMEVLIDCNDNGPKVKNTLTNHVQGSGYSHVVTEI